MAKERKITAFNKFRFSFSLTYLRTHHYLDGVLLLKSTYRQKAKRNSAGGAAAAGRPRSCSWRDRRQHGTNGLLGVVRSQSPRRIVAALLKDASAHPVG